MAICMKNELRVYSQLYSLYLAIRSIMHAWVYEYQLTINSYTGTQNGQYCLQLLNWDYTK